MSVSRETRRELYQGLLARWGLSLNLTSARDRDRFNEHYADSVTVLPHLPNGLDRVIDLGSGQGFPAIPLAIETGLAVDLIEADRRKAAFLTTVMATLTLRGTVSACRIEDATLPPARCITARALASLPTLATLARPLLAEGGVCLFLKGGGAAAELAAARQTGVVGVILPSDNPGSCLVKLTALG